MVNELVIMHGQQAVTTSLKVAEVFEKNHRDVTRSIDGLKKDVRNFAQMFLEGNEPDSYGRNRRIYYMNRDGFTLLAMGFTGKKAMQFKLQYIEAFNAMEHRLTTEQDSYMIADPIERAKRWIEEQKALKETQKQLEIAKPKVLFADSVSSSETTILIGVLAKIIKQNGVEYLTVEGKPKPMGQNNFFKWLRENGYLISRKGDSWNTPTQKAMDMGLFEVKESTTPNPDGSVRITKTTKVTGKGQQYFINKLLGENAA